MIKFGKCAGKILEKRCVGGYLQRKYIERGLFGRLEGSTRGSVFFHVVWGEKLFACRLWMSSSETLP